MNPLRTTGDTTDTTHDALTPDESRASPLLDPEPDFVVLRELLDAGGPSIVYQTITHIDTGKVLGAEALSRFPAWFQYASVVRVGGRCRARC